MANAAPVSHPLKEIFKAKKVALGLLTRLARSGDIARIAKTTGHDFVFLDGQHAAYNIETIGHIAQAALGIGIAPLVRVRSCDDPQTQVILDIGATGITVDTAAATSSIVTSVISGAGRLTKNGAGSLQLGTVLNTPNTFTGGVTLNGGMLTFPGENLATATSPNALGAAPASAVANYIELNNGATLRSLRRRAAALSVRGSARRSFSASRRA